ncbi:hypothetical protein U1Q18_045929, partial [Sarracenia purpurea var. burkii]
LVMMMMNGKNSRSNPTVLVPPWDLLDDPTASMFSSFSGTATDISVVNASSPNGDSSYSPSTFDTLKALHRYLPSNYVSDSDDFQIDDTDIPVDAFSCDQFRMFDFKVKRCARGRSHDWTECPFAHPGEKARRRDPRKFHYAGTACPEFRKGQCVKGDACEFAHGVFECWLHPARYRTQPCKDGTQCRRRVCFFAHTPDQLRVLPQCNPKTNESYDGSPSRFALDSYMSKGSFGSSPSSTLYSPPLSPPSESPPMSPNRSLSVNSVSELAASMRTLQFGKGMMSMSPPAWGGLQMGSGYCSPRSPSTLRPGSSSIPSTPTRTPTRSGLGVFDLWDHNCGEEPVMERVESGKDLRAKIYAKLSKENSLVRVDSASPVPDVGWVSELVK